MSAKRLALALVLVSLAVGGLSGFQEPRVELKPVMVVADSVKDRYTAVKTRLRQVAERMPEADYGFRPTPAMETFAVRIAHIADLNFDQCTWIVDKPHPYKGVDLDAKFTTRPELIALLEESFAYCDAYFDRLSPAVLTEIRTVEAPPGASFREVKVEKGRVAIDVITHNVEMYGYLAVYLRLKGLVPPTSSR